MLGPDSLCYILAYHGCASGTFVNRGNHDFPAVLWIVATRLHSRRDRFAARLSLLIRAWPYCCIRGGGSSVILDVPWTLDAPAPGPAPRQAPRPIRSGAANGRMFAGRCLRVSKDVLSYMSDESQIETTGTCADGKALGNAVTIVPNSGIQFLQFELHASDLQFVYCRFLEEEVTLDGRRARILHALELDHTTLYHPVSGRALTPEATVFISGQQGLEPFLDQWMPVPFLRVPKTKGDPGKSARLESGPSNWVRAFVTRPPGRKDSESFDIVLAFDTAISRGKDGTRRSDAAPSETDLASSRQFALSDHAEDAAAFLSEPWIDEWLVRALARYRARDTGHAAAPSAMVELEHVARYLTYLSVLRRACGALKAGFADTLSTSAQARVVDVDLVLDIGNSRTTGVLVEAPAESDADANKPIITPIALRDLSRPWIVHPSPVESRIEFNRASFGDEALSRRSGRAGAFLWPSLVRVGREAVWLAARPSAREGTTGLASAKRHLADSRSSEEAWRFVAGREASGDGPVVTGPMLAHLNERGEILENGGLPAVRPRFSRSALFGMFVAELIVHALTMLNAPAATTAAPARMPRRLRRVVLTMPFSAGTEERETIARRVRDAIDIVWQTTGWSELGTAAQQKPVVEIGFDEAMSAQLVYMFNEVTQKLRAPAADYVALMGKSRPEHGARPSLRVASLDIGGGSSGLTIVTYAHKDQHAVNPTLSCTARTRQGGDEALLAIISRIVTPAIASALAARGMRDPRAFLHDALGIAVGGVEPDDLFARRFLAQYAQPIALVILKEYEQKRVGARHAVRHSTLGLLAHRAEGLSTAVADELEAHAAELGARDFRLAATPVVIASATVSAAIRSSLRPALSELLDIVDAYDCDQVLLTGWVSRLSEIMDIVLERLPDRPERIVQMHNYSVGGWYPFARNAGRIGDPKSTAVAGTLLGRRSAELMQGVQLRIGELTAEATRQLGFARARGIDEWRGVSRREPGAQQAAAWPSPGDTNENGRPRRLLGRLDTLPEVILLDAVASAPRSQRPDAP